MVRNAIGDDGEMRLILAGEIDLASHDVLLTEIIQLVGGSATHLVIDLEAVTFVDSGGVGVLVKGYHAARDTGCGYKIVNPQGMVKQVLEITGVLATLITGSPSRRKLRAAN